MNVEPKTLEEALLLYSDEDYCHQYAVAMRWPDGVRCPMCDSERCRLIATRRVFMCNGCRKQFTVKVGSIFEDSPISIGKWLTVLWILSHGGASSHEIARTIGVTQKSAWGMVDKIRKSAQATEPA